MTNSNLLIVDAAAVFLDGLKYAPYMVSKNIFKSEGITKKNFLVSRYSRVDEWVKKYNAGAVVVVFDRSRINTLLKQHAETLLKVAERQIEAFSKHVSASGFELLEINEGSTFDCINQLVAHAKGNGDTLTIIGDDVLLTRHIDKLTEVQFSRPLDPLTESTYRSDLNINPSQIWILSGWLGLSGTRRS